MFRRDPQSQEYQEAIWRENHEAILQDLWKPTLSSGRLSRRDSQELWEFWVLQGE